jgi:very-short-patch-repair endonuclease
MEKTRALTFARNLRSNQTSAELKLWASLRRRGLGGYRFNRQVTIGLYIADFVCREKALVVEVDGDTHGDRLKIQHDYKRTIFLRTQGYQVFRVNNIDVYENLTGVLDALLGALEAAESAFQRKAPIALRALPQQVGEEDDADSALDE